MIRGLRTCAAAAATATLMVATSVSTTHAAAAAGTCTITVIAPVLSTTKTIYGSATIKCTAATSITGSIQIVELDYATGASTITASSPEDATMPATAKVALNAVAVAKGATVTVCVPGGPLVAPATKCTGTISISTDCVAAAPKGFNTESGNEEYATKLVTSIPAAATDRTLPKDNAFAC